MKLVNYQAPKWFLDHKLAKRATNLEKVIPKKRLELLDLGHAHSTQIQKLNSKINNKYEIYVKRDDQTHRELQLQGNKLRKLEFLFAEALQKNAKHILTAGGLQSNHCRTVAAVSKSLNLNTHLFLRSDSNDPSKLNLNGNLLIDVLLDSKIYLIEKRAQYLEDIEYRMKILADKLEKNLNESSYIIPIGGSNTTGLFGYLEQFDEMLNGQNINEFIQDIVVTAGSGGTMSGIAIANYMTGSKFRVHAFCVCDNSKYFYKHLKEQFLDLFGHDTGVNTNDLVNIIECSRGLGYAKSTRDEMHFLAAFLRKHSILLDPVYTAKSMFTLINLLNGSKPTLAFESDKNATSFLKNLKGESILFIHTGGQLGNFNDSMTSVKSMEKIVDCFGDKINSI